MRGINGDISTTRDSIIITTNNSMFCQIHHIDLAGVFHHFFSHIIVSPLIKFHNNIIIKQSKDSLSMMLGEIALLNKY